MSKATVYAAAQYGLATETTATGLVVGSISWDGSCDTVELPDHIGCVIGLSVGNPRKEVKCDGIIATKATGLVGNLGAVLTLSNTTTNSRTRNSSATKRQLDRIEDISNAKAKKAVGIR